MIRRPLKNLVNTWRGQDRIGKFVIAGSLLLVLFAYLPTLQFDYVTQDQWRAFRYADFGGSPWSRATACMNMLPGYYLQTGRPLVWMSECIDHAAVYKISDFALLRPVVLGFVLLTVLEVGLTLAPFVGGLAVGAAAASTFVLSPGYSFMYLQSMPALMVLIAVILAARSYRLCSTRANALIDRRTLLASSLFFLACLMYPAYAFIVVAVSIVEFGFDTTRDLPARLQRLCGTLSIYAATALVYLLFVKASVACLVYFVGSQPSLGLYNVTPQIVPQYLLTQTATAATYVYKMPPLNFLTPHGLNYAIMVLFSIGGGWLTTRNRSFGATLRASLLIACVTCILMVASLAPWIVSQFTYVVTRQLLPVYLFLCAAVFGLLSGTLQRTFGPAARWIPLAVALGLLLPVSLIQNRLSFLEIVVTNSEIDVFRLAINQWVAESGWKHARSILVVLPHAGRPEAVADLMNNTGFGFDNAVLATHANPVSVLWMLRAVLREHPNIPDFSLVDCGSDMGCTTLKLADPNTVVVNYVHGDVPITTSVAPLVINPSLLTSTPVTPRITIVQQPTIKVSSQIPGLGPAGLFLAAEPGWHAERNPSYPQTVFIDFKSPRLISKLSLLPQDDSLPRMPKTFSILVSMDGQSWSNAATVQNLCQSTASDGWHVIALAKPIKAQFMKISITANCGDPSFLTIRGLRTDSQK